MTKISDDKFDKQETWQGDFKNQIRTDSGKISRHPTNSLEENTATQNTENRGGDGNGETQVIQHKTGSMANT